MPAAPRVTLMRGVPGWPTLQPDGLASVIAVSRGTLLSSGVFRCIGLSSGQSSARTLLVHFTSGVNFVCVFMLNHGTMQGSYSDQPGGDAAQHCRPCEAGRYCGRAGLPDPQGLCNPGHYCTSGASTASPVGCGCKEDFPQNEPKCCGMTNNLSHFNACAAVPFE